MTDLLVQSPVIDLADRFWQWFLARQPIYATVLGDDRYDDRLPDPSAAARTAEAAALKGFLADAKQIERRALDQEDVITLDMLEVVARIWLRQHEHQVHQFEAIDQMSGPQNLPGDLSRFQRVDTPERIDRLIHRLQAYPEYLGAASGKPARGHRRWRCTAAAPVVARVIEQTRRAVAGSVDDSPLLMAHPELAPEARERVRSAIEENVMPALADHLAALEGYAPHARTGEGIWALPDGRELYATMILASTTLDETPEAIHGYGLEQLEAIRAETLEIARELRFADVGEMREALVSETSNYAANGAEIVERARRQIEKANAAAPRWFGRLPVAPCEVRAVEPYQEAEAPPAFYFPPAPDGSRDGIYFVNTYQPAESSSLPACDDDLPRGDTGPPLPDHDRERADRDARLPPVRFAPDRRRLPGGLGAVQRAAGRRDGPLRECLGAPGHARRAGLASGAARRGHRHPRLPVEPRAIGRAAAHGWTLAARGRDGDGPLHRAAGPGARLHDRHARNSRPASPSWSSATATAST